MCPRPVKYVIVNADERRRGLYGSPLEGTACHREDDDRRYAIGSEAIFMCGRIPGRKKRGHLAIQRIRFLGKTSSVQALISLQSTRAGAFVCGKSSALMTARSRAGNPGSIRSTSGPLGETHRFEQCGDLGQCRGHQQKRTGLQYGRKSKGKIFSLVGKINNTGWWKYDGYDPEDVYKMAAVSPTAEFKAVRPGPSSGCANAGLAVALMSSLPPVP